MTRKSPEDYQKITLYYHLLLCMLEDGEQKMLRKQFFHEEGGLLLEQEGERPFVLSWCSFSCCALTDNSLS